MFEVWSLKIADGEADTRKVDLVKDLFKEAV